MKSRRKAMLLSVLMAAVFGVCNLGGVARLSFVSKADDDFKIKADPTEVNVVAGDSASLTVQDNAGNPIDNVTWELDSTATTGQATLNGGSITFGKAGVVAVTAKKDSKSDTMQFTVKPKVTVSINSLPDGTVNSPYNQSITLSSEGAENPTYELTGLPTELSFDSSTGAITGIPTTADQYDLSLTVKTTVSGTVYTSAPKEITLIINDAATPVLDSITIITEPTKTAYTEGESFDKAGMAVEATYSNGPKKDVTNECTFLPSSDLKTSDTTITVSYTDGSVTKNAIQNITVKAKTLASIAVTTPPTKVAYTAGDKFDPTGMVVTATYVGGSTATVTGYTHEPDINTALTTANTSVTITYKEGSVTSTATLPITVTAAPIPPKTLSITYDNKAIPADGLTIAKDDTTKVLGVKALADDGKTDASNSVTWTVADTSVLTMDTAGKIRPLKVGSTTVTATSKVATGVSSDPVKITIVNALADDVTISAQATKVTVGDTLPLTAKVTPDAAANEPVTWTSSDATIATVSTRGEVKGVKAGEVKITATAGGKSKTVTLTVVAAGNPVIRTTSTLTGAKTGSAYKASLSASGIDSNKQKWTITSDSKTSATDLKDKYGLTLEENGTLSGTPILASTGLELKIRVANVDDEKLYDEKTFTLVIDDSAIIGVTAAMKDNGTVTGNPVSGVAGSNIDDYATANSRTLAENGKIVQIDLETTRLASDKVGSKDDVDRLTRVAFHGFADNEITIAYLNIDVLKKVKDQSATTFDSANDKKISDTGTPIEIALNVDKTVLGKNPVITRIHGDQTKNFTKLASKPTKDFVDGTYYIDATNGVLYLYSRYFSYYTIAYADNAHLVTFNLDGGTGVPEQLLVKHGATIADLTEPTKTGYNFDGWFTDAAKNNLWNDTDAINADMALYASWTTGQSTNRAPRSQSGTAEQEESTVRGSRTGDNKEAERIARLLAIMTTTWIVLFNALAFGKKRRQRVRRR